MSLQLSSCFTTKPVYTDSTCTIKSRKQKIYFDKKKGQTAIRETISNCGNPACLVMAPLMAVGVPVGSFLVSGSIVVAGNTVHWLERQGKCDDSITQSALTGIKNGLLSTGGKVISTTQDAINWLKNKLSSSDNKSS